MMSTSLLPPGETRTISTAAWYDPRCVMIPTIVATIESALAILQTQLGRSCSREGGLTFRGVVAGSSEGWGTRMMSLVASRSMLESCSLGIPAYSGGNSS